MLLSIATHLFLLTVEFCSTGAGAYKQGKNNCTKTRRSKRGRGLFSEEYGTKTMCTYYNRHSNILTAGVQAIQHQMCMYYRITGKFGRKLNLAVWWSARATTKLNSAKISYLHIYVWQSHTEPPNLNPPIRLQRQFGTQPPNLIPTNISGYTVCQ